jgi:diguanylate cyclase
MPHFDIITMVFMLVVVTFLLAGVLAIASLQAGNILGLKHWALANLCIAAGFSLSFIPQPLNPIKILLGVTCLALGQSLQYTGIQLFKYGQCNYQFPVWVTLTVLCQTIIFNFIYPDIEIRAMLNSLALAFTNGMCARQLLIRVPQPMRTAYWLSGFSFAALAMLMLMRFINLILAYPSNYTLFAQVPINLASFFMASIAQLVITFGFVLMLNYTLASKLEKLAHTDELTGVLNRRALFTIARKLCAQFARNGHSISLLMLDIDHFKSINDRFGHPVGDDVLCQFTKIARNLVREGDFIGRYGGEEFCILLPDTDLSEAMHLAERIRVHYTEIELATCNGDALHCTVSIGIAHSQAPTIDFEQLLKAADQALYQAKADGRDCVRVASPVPAMPNSKYKIA